MSRNPNNVMTGIFDGACYWAPLTAMHPNGFDQDLTSLGYADLGFIDEAGSPTLSLPGNGDATPVRVWQRAQVIRNIRTPIDETPTFTMTLAETTVEALEAALGTTINPDGSYVINSSVERPHGCLVLDVLTAQGGRRYFAPNAVITEIGDIEVFQRWQHRGPAHHGLR